MILLFSLVLTVEKHSRITTLHYIEYTMRIELYLWIYVSVLYVE